jgi:hypothetical protein
MASLKVAAVKEKVYAVLSGAVNPFITPHNSDTFLIKEVNEQATLKDVRITGISPNHGYFWELHLEKNIPGFTPASKKFENVLVHFHEGMLQFYMFELKSTLTAKQDVKRGTGISTYEGIAGKLNDTIDHCLYALTLPNRHGHDYEQWKLRFHAVIFYGKATSGSDPHPLHHVFQSSRGLYTVNPSVLGPLKIPVSFHQARSGFELSFDQLKWNRGVQS